MITPPEVKSPCPMRWSDMQGDGRRRFCEHCQLHVRNLSAMSRRSVSRVVARSAHERVCVTYTVRADGSLLTRWESVANWAVRPLRGTMAWLLAACFPIVLSACQTTQSEVLGELSPGCKPPPQKKVAAAEQERVVVTGGI